MELIYTNVAAWLIAGVMLQNAYIAIAGVLLNAVAGGIICLKNAQPWR
ncbi:hypothetical protein HF324_18565 [Chitinophaga oryzae]|uniref:Uncharacterized protein n=1 Tax=Chitinophaga oryzae TaxID=2725414 RepID=A0ABX6LIC0_9BACT|nr:hypothetical protein [Chitinophaga oryzae]QJB39752.1 hypothetical protein HF324_18565 [Chitinophaga oryzae]